VTIVVWGLITIDVLIACWMFYSNKLHKLHNESTKILFKKINRLEDIVRGSEKNDH